MMGEFKVLLIQLKDTTSSVISANASILSGLNETFWNLGMVADTYALGYMVSKLHLSIDDERVDSYERFDR